MSTSRFFSHPLLQSIEKLTEAYRGSVFVADRETNDEVIAVVESGAAQALQQGLTVYMDDLTLLIPDASDFLRQLEKELGMPSDSTRLGVFVSSPVMRNSEPEVVIFQKDLKLYT